MISLSQFPLVTGVVSQQRGEDDHDNSINDPVLSKNRIDATAAAVLMEGVAFRTGRVQAGDESGVWYA